MQLNKKFGSLFAAFKAVDTSGEGTVGYMEFDHMLRLCNMGSETRFTRKVFGKVVGPNKELNFDKFRQALLSSTLSRYTRFE